jgi:hypothetical protein
MGRLKKRKPWIHPEIVEIKEGTFTLMVVIPANFQFKPEIQKELREEATKILTKALGYKPKTYKEYTDKYINGEKK